MNGCDQRLHVGIDGLNLALPNGTGVATYARSVGDAVAELGGQVDLLFGLPVPRTSPPESRESLFFAQMGLAEPEPSAPSRPTVRAMFRRTFQSPLARRLVPVPLNGRVIMEAHQERLPPFERLFTLGGLWTIAARHFRRYGRFLPVRIPNPPPVMHWTYPVPVRLVGSANIYTVHDLVPLRLPQTTLDDKAYHHRLLAQCAREGVRICTVSDHSRADILRFVDVDPDKVVNCYQSVPRAVPHDEGVVERRLQSYFGLKAAGYFLYFGAIEPKKNIGRLIEAYLASGIESPLVLVGGRAWKSEAELALLQFARDGGSKPAARIIQLDYLSRAQLDLLRAGARAVLFPSLYEGFGLPAVEAMAHGIPVIASTAGSLPEITREAALLVDPYDVNDIAAAIQRVDGDAALRRAMAAAGRAQALRFSPASFREALERLYRPFLEAAALSETHARPATVYAR